MPTPDQVARIVSAARAVGRDGQIQVPHMLQVAGEIRNAQVFTDADGRTFGLRCDLPMDEWASRRMTTLQSGVTSSRALASAVVARKGAVRIENALGSEDGPARGPGGGFAAVTISGPATLAADLEILGALDVAVEERDALADRLRTAMGDGGEVAARIFRVVGFRGPESDNTTFELGARAPQDVVSRIKAHARALQISRSQLAVLDELSGAPQSVRAIARPDVIVPGLVVVYGEQSMAVAQTVIAAVGITYDGWQRFAEMSQHLGANTVRRVELTLGVDRPTASLAVDVSL